MNSDSGSEYVRSEDEGNAGRPIHISDNKEQPNYNEGQNKFTSDVE